MACNTNHLLRRQSGTPTTPHPIIHLPLVGRGRLRLPRMEVRPLQVSLGTHQVQAMDIAVVIAHLPPVRHRERMRKPLERVVASMDMATTNKRA